LLTARAAIVNREITVVGSILIQFLAGSLFEEPFVVSGKWKESPINLLGGTFTASLGFSLSSNVIFSMQK
jgi:hypothetical protein